VSRFFVLRVRTHFRRYIGRRVPFSSFALPDSFSAILRTSGPVFMFRAPGLIFGVTERAESLFYVLRSRTHFQRYRGRRVPFSCFAPPDSFSAVPRASGPIFMFCAPGLIFDGTEGVGSRFLVLPARNNFRRYRGRQISFLCFQLPEMFSAVSRVSGPFFMFCASGIVFDGTEGIGSRFFVLCTRTHFRWYRGRRVLFSCFALPDSFSAIPRTLGPFFMFCAPGLVFGRTDGDPFRFHVFRYRACFRRNRGRRVPFSCFVCPKSLSLVQRASGPVFMFYAPELIFSGTQSVPSLFLIFSSRKCFR
jgi:hypothetical protein